jgi:hypothetical protein
VLSSVQIEASRQACGLATGLSMAKNEKTQKEAKTEKETLQNKQTNSVALSPQANYTD